MNTMHRGNGARIFPVILVLIIIAIAIAALVSAGRAIFGGGEQAPTTTDTSRDSLLNTGAGYSVRMTVRGPLVAEENFRSYQITVSSTERNMTTYQGYLESSLENSQLGNNQAAYDEFVHALDKANLVKGQQGDSDDTRGICATGRVYEFEVLEGANAVKRLWTSTCKGSPGTLKANIDQVANLFQKQIPDEKKLRNKIDL